MSAMPPQPSTQAPRHFFHDGLHRCWSGLQNVPAWITAGFFHLGSKLTGRADDYAIPPPRNLSADARELALMAARQPSPENLPEAVRLMRRWTRLPEHLRPEVDFKHAGIGSHSKMGFLAWLVDVQGSRIYRALRHRHPREAAAFRQQLLATCAARENFLSNMGGASLVRVFSRALARHAREFPDAVLVPGSPAETALVKKLASNRLSLFLPSVQEYALVVQSNTAFVRGELPRIDIAPSLAAAITDVCNRLDNTSREAPDELQAWRFSRAKPYDPPMQEVVRKTVKRIDDDLHALHALVQSLRTEGLSYTLVAESAVNTLGTYGDVVGTADAYHAACKRLKPEKRRKKPRTPAHPDERGKPVSTSDADTRSRTPMTSPSPLFIASSCLPHRFSKTTEGPDKNAR